MHVQPGRVFRQIVDVRRNFALRTFGQAAVFAANLVVPCPVADVRLVPFHWVVPYGLRRGGLHCGGCHEGGYDELFGFCFHGGGCCPVCGRVEAKLINIAGMWNGYFNGALFCSKNVHTFFARFRVQVSVRFFGGKKYVPCILKFKAHILK